MLSLFVQSSFITMFAVYIYSVMRILYAFTAVQTRTRADTHSSPVSVSDASHSASEEGPLLLAVRRELDEERLLREADRQVRCFL